MLYRNTESNERPDKVRLETLPEGETRVILADNIREETRVEGRTAGAEGEIAGPVFVYDELSFILPEDREETAETIADNFADWWTYGTSEPEAPLTVEERVEILEELLLYEV